MPLTRPSGRRVFGAILTATLAGTADLSLRRARQRPDTRPRAAIGKIGHATIGSVPSAPTRALRARQISSCIYRAFEGDQP